MITIFNRKELITVYSMQSQAKMRDILTENGIDYKIRVCLLYTSYIYHFREPPFLVW